MYLSRLEIRDWRLKVVLTDVFFVAKGFSMQFNNEAVAKVRNINSTGDRLTPSGSSLNSGPTARKRKSPDEWAEIWFRQLCRLHRKSKNSKWQFSLDQVIAFLRSRVEKREPAWKRLKIVEALIRFQKDLPKDEQTDLSFVRRKLVERAAQERDQEHDPTGGSMGEPLEVSRSPEEIIGKISPHEAPLIQDLRRKLRLAGRAPNTEVAYVKWATRFLKSRGVSTREQCLVVDRQDVEAFLTEIGR